MKLGRRSKYAVRALVELTLYPERCPHGTGKVARRTRMPEAFVGQILGQLVRNGIVEGRRGAGGGFCLAVPPEEVSVLDVVEALDGEPRVAGTPSPDEPVAVRRVWEEAVEALERVLARHTIAELAAEEKARAGRHAPDGCQGDVATDPERLSAEIVK